MFERLESRGEQAVEARAAERRDRLAARLREAAPGDVSVAVEDEAVVLSGRGLGRRFALEAELRWLVAESSDER